jgi:hypothetical protein
LQQRYPSKSILPVILSEHGRHAKTTATEPNRTRSKKILRVHRRSIRPKKTSITASERRPCFERPGSYNRQPSLALSELGQQSGRSAASLESVDTRRSKDRPTMQGPQPWHLWRFTIGPPPASLTSWSVGIRSTTDLPYSSVYLQGPVRSFASAYDPQAGFWSKDVSVPNRNVYF